MAAAAELPEGTLNLFVQNKNLNQYGLLVDAEGPNLPHNFVPFMLLNKQEVLDECKAIGFMSDFHPVMAQLQLLKDDKILLICDPEQTYGDSWRVALTSAAAQRETEAIEAEEVARVKLAEAVRLESDRLAAQELAAANATYEDTPFLAKPYLSASADGTHSEVASLNVESERPLIAFSVRRPVESSGHAAAFSDRAADNDKYVEHRAQKNPDFDLRKRESSISLQASPATAASTTQTTWHKPANASTQAAPVADALDVDALGSLSAFLMQATRLVEEALQQNETVDIFTTAFHGVGDDEAAVSNKGENELKELRTFNDILYSKNMSLACIDWHPFHKGMVAVAPIRNLDFDDRIELSGRAANSFVLVWDFTDLIHPQLMLESPQELGCFAFNPQQHHLVAAGALNGQVLLWDTSVAMEVLVRRQHRSMKSSSSNVAGDDDEAAAAPPPIKPFALSCLDSTHKRGVADLRWLAPRTQINSRGVLVQHPVFDEAEDDDEKKQLTLPDVSYQFITVSGDGSVLFWDTRFREIAEGKLPHLHRRHGAAAEKPCKDGKPAVPPWNPLFSMQLKRLEGVGEVSLCRVCLLDGAGDERKTQLFCSSEEGEIVFADWRARPAGAAQSKKGEDDDVGDDETPEYVQWMASDHSRPATVLEQSPFYGDLVISVGDWNFQLWRLGSKTSVFASPASAVPLTCGCWSPTRPGMLYMARIDGAVDVWDLTDSSYRPSATLLVAPCRITSIKFLPPSTVAAAKQHLLAVGDKAGNLHVFEVPRALWRPQASERALMDTFVQGEMGRVEYVEQRAEARLREGEGDEEEETSNGFHGASSPPGLGMPAPVPDAVEEFDAAELEAINGAYNAKQQAFMDLMGLKPTSATSGIQASNIAVNV